MVSLTAFLLGSLLSGYFVKTIYCREVGGMHEVKIPSHINLEKALEKQNLVDAVIIGSGPAGLSSAIYTSRLARKTLVILGNNQGGQLMGTSYVENWPGISKILGPELMSQLQNQAASFGPSIINDAVERVDLSTWPYVISTENGLQINALTVIVATGSSPRKLGIPGEQEYWGRGVTTCAICDAPFYKGADVVVVGGGDSAVEEAIQIAPYAKSVTILVRSSKMRATPVMQSHLAGYNNIKIQHNVAIQKILGDDVHVTGIELIDTVTQQLRTMPITGVFLAIGHIPNTQLLKDSVDVSDEGYILMHDRSQATSAPGVFAAGDVEDNVYRQAGIAAGSGIKAAIDADRFLTALGLDKAAQEKLRPHYFVAEESKKHEIAEIETLKQYEQVLGDGSIPVVLDFYTPSCPSCLQMLPVLAETAEEFAGKIKAVKVNAENSIELVEKYRVYKVPCLIVIQNRALVARFNEAMSKKELVDLMAQVTAD